MNDVPRVCSYMLDECKYRGLSRIAKKICVGSLNELRAAAFNELYYAVYNTFKLTDNAHRIDSWQAASRLWVRRVSGSKHLCLRELSIPGGWRVFECSICEMPTSFTTRSAPLTLTIVSLVAIGINTPEELNLILATFNPEITP